MHALLIFKEKAVDKKQSVLKNFLTYIKIDTQSDDTSDTVPSTAKTAESSQGFDRRNQGSWNNRGRAR